MQIKCGTAAAAEYYPGPVYMSNVCLSLFIIYSPGMTDKALNGKSFLVCVGSTPTSNTPPLNMINSEFEKTQFVMIYCRG